MKLCAKLTMVCTINREKKSLPDLNFTGDIQLGITFNTETAFTLESYMNHGQ